MASPPSPSDGFFAVHPFVMDDVTWNWQDNPTIFLKREEDYTPALPFIQEFERPPITVESLALEMSYRFGMSLNAMVAAIDGGQNETQAI